MVMKKLIAGNWKMNGLVQDSMDRVNDLLELMESKSIDNAEFLICPPATLLSIAKSRIGNTSVKLGGQDCHFNNTGAHTGDISAEMLKNIGCSHVILGHSERRADHAETSELIASKSKSAYDNDLIAVICVGETEEDREDGQEFDIVLDQLSKSIPQGANSENTIIAYEPVWAIGTGKTASSDDIESMHKFIRAKLDGLVAGSDKVRILYGGSVKPENANIILNIKNVDGALVGGASLKAASFYGIADNI